MMRQACLFQGETYHLQVPETLAEISALYGDAFVLDTLRSAVSRAQVLIIKAALRKGASVSEVQSRLDAWRPRRAGGAVKADDVSRGIAKLMRSKGLSEAFIAETLDAWHDPILDQVSQAHQEPITRGETSFEGVEPLKSGEDE